MRTQGARTPNNWRHVHAPCGSATTPSVSETEQLPPKKDVARALLLRGSVFVHLDPRMADVSVPDFLRGQPQLVLQIGLDLPVPITDLRVDDAGVFGTLFFTRSPHTCVVPWNAVFALVGDDGKGMVWPEDMPKEIAAEVESAKPKAELRSISFGDKPSIKPRAKPQRRPALSEPPTVGARPRSRRSSNPAAATKSVGPRTPATIVDAASDKKRGKLRELPPYLRVIK